MGSKNQQKMLEFALGNSFFGNINTVALEELVILFEFY